jgi:hypothetical protein
VIVGKAACTDGRCARRAIIALRRLVRVSAYRVGRPVASKRVASNRKHRGEQQYTTQTMQRPSSDAKACSSAARRNSLRVATDSQAGSGAPSCSASIGARAGHATLSRSSPQTEKPRAAAMTGSVGSNASMVAAASGEQTNNPTNRIFESRVTTTRGNDNATRWRRRGFRFRIALH